MKAKVDRDICIGVGNCEAVAPAAFKLDDERKAVVQKAKVEDSLLMKAAESCPVNAITIEDDNGNQVYP